MSVENITVDPLTGEPQLSPSVETTTVETKESLPNSDLSGLSLQELNSALGKNYKDKDSALRSLKDTISHVGMKEEQIEQKLVEKGYLSRADLETELFYRDNPNLSTHKSVIDAFAKINGISPQEAVKSEALSGLFAKAQKADTYENNQSVIESNPRLVATKSGLDKARELSTKRNSGEQVDSLVARAVLDSLGE